MCSITFCHTLLLIYYHSTLALYYLRIIFTEQALLFGVEGGQHLWLAEGGQNQISTNKRGEGSISAWLRWDTTTRPHANRHKDMQLTDFISLGAHSSKKKTIYHLSCELCLLVSSIAYFLGDLRSVFLTCSPCNKLLFSCSSIQH